jgi:methyl-accepting chemotaxis protein
VDKVAAGTKLVDAAGQTMQEIVGSVKKVSDLIAEIAAASQEQSTSVGQINATTMQLNQISQQNASSSEELAATSEEMSGQAQGLQQLIGFFKVDDARSVQRAPDKITAGRHAAMQPRVARSKASHAPMLATSKAPEGFVEY